MKRPKLPVVRTSLVTRDELAWTTRPRPKYPISHRAGRQRGRRRRPMGHNTRVNILLTALLLLAIGNMIFMAALGVELYG